MTAREEAVAAVASDLVGALGDMALLYAEGGAEAVADAAWLPGGPSREELAARYQALADVAIAERAAGSEAA